MGYQISTVNQDIGSQAVLSQRLVDVIAGFWMDGQVNLCSPNLVAQCQHTDRGEFRDS